MATITLRNVPESVRARLIERAAASRRTLTQQVLHELDREAEAHPSLLDPDIRMWVHSFPAIAAAGFEEFIRHGRA
jgi:hypothetical protein